MFPKGLVAPLVFCAAGAGLQVHEQNIVTVLGDHGWRLGLEKCDDDLIGRIFVTDETVWAISFDKPISGLQLSNAQLVVIPGT